jgi:hypothetical protein
MPTEIYSQLIDETRRIKAQGKSRAKNGSNNSVDLGGVAPSSTQTPKKDADGDVQMALNTSKKGGKNTCPHCNRIGHKEKKCWIKHPELKPPNKGAKADQGAAPNQSNATGSESGAEMSLVTMLPDNVIISTRTPIQSQINLQRHWILDSRGSVHVTCNPRGFIQGSTSSIEAVIAWGRSDREPIKATWVGDVWLRNPSTKQTLIIRDVLYIPEFGINILSTGVLAQKGAKFELGTDVKMNVLKNNLRFKS